MIRIERKEVTEVDYAKLYSEVFGDLKPNTPRYVYLVYDETSYIGFMSGFPLDAATFYLQIVGFTPNEQKRVKNIARSAAAIDTLHQDWYGLLVLIENLNIEALRVALSIGFVVMGTRMDTGRNLWVELMHVKGKEDASK